MKTRMPMTPLAALLALALAVSPQAGAQQASFETPEAAAEALVEALGPDQADAGELASLLGPDWKQFIPTEGVHRVDVDYFLDAYRTRHELKVEGDTAHLLVGEGHWTLPVPIAKGGQGWGFDIKAGAEEIRARRIGDNELLTRQSVLAYHDAQMDYSAIDRDDDGVLEYAQKILSTEGQHDGLYWSEDATGDLSPLGPLYADASPGQDWHGYRFRILKAQGESAPGGAYDYMLGDNMSRGFALVAWPAEYAETGVMSFMISHEGQVFEKDLGPDSESVATGMERFDPDSSWSEMSRPGMDVVEGP